MYSEVTAALRVPRVSHARPAPGSSSRNVDQQLFAESVLLLLRGVAKGVREHATTFHLVVLLAVQMPVDPHACQRQELIQRITKTGGAGRDSIARISTAQTGREVRDHHRGAFKGPR